ncbi:MAG: choice-of-anchor L domain-containing protein, partial [Phycisphaerae bacterium]
MSLRRIPALIAVLAVTVVCIVPMTRLLGQSSVPPRSAPVPATPAKESGLVLDSNCTSDPPGFVVTWETDAERLKDKLLAGTPPAGVTITGWSIAPDPDDIGTNETIGYYEDFDVTDGTNSLSVPDGVILTTGTFVDGNDNHANYCNDVDAFTGESSDYGDEDVAAMYRPDIRPDVYDGASLTITFTSGPLIAGLRLNVLLASDEFAYYAAPAPTPADPEQQSAVSCYPDTFGAFLDGDPFGFAKDNEGNPVLISVAEQVINLNNNTWPGADHDVTNGCGELTAESYTNVDFNIEYDGIAARQVSPGNWGPLKLSAPLAPTGQGEEHTLKLALTDVTDNILDTAAFISGLEFIACNCPPSDADGDGDVDIGDFGIFQDCFNGPNRPYKLDADVCFCMDADHDADIDVADFLVFQSCFNGP